ncbi:MAG: AAA-like domain-containing protein [Candidatus Parabeggiatoa sp.]|nr:AAA-like domain-containing protein [Candidatus Parabeggiatoa sp.]
MPNPYVAGNVVGNGPAFVGRNDILLDVKNVLDSPQNTIVLYGNRRIGKTSILRELEKKLSQEQFVPIFFSLEDKAEHPLGQVLQSLANAIHSKLELQTNLDLGNDPERKFREWLLNVVLKKLSIKTGLVLLIDEFDEFAEKSRGQQRAQHPFFPYLRDLLNSNSPQLNFVFAVGRRIDDLKETLSLFKGSITQRVSLLSRQDTEKIIRFSVENNSLNWTNDAIEKVWQLTHGHPFLTQLLCFQIWSMAYRNRRVQRKKLPEVTLQNVDNAIPTTLNNAAGAINWVWAGLGTMERLVASALAEAGAGSITETQLANLLSQSNVPINIENQKDAAHILLEWDLIEPTEDRHGYRFRVELLRRWIKKNKPLSEEQRDWETLDETAYGHYQAAEPLYKIGQVDAALANVRKAVEKNPDHLRANKLLATILLEQNEVDEACEVLERLRKYQPQVAHPLLVQAWLKSAEASDSFKEQLELYEKILSIDSENKTAKNAIKTIWQTQAEEAYRGGELEKALEFYQKAELNEKAAKIQAEIWQKQADEAYHREDLNTALELYQKAGLNEKVAKIQQKMEVYTKPIAEFEAAINEIIEASKGRLTGIFLYEMTDDVVFYDSQNSSTSKKNLHNLLLRQQASQPVINSFETTNIKEALDFFGEQAQCGELKQIILQTSNDLRIVYFSEKANKTVAIGFISSMGLGPVNTVSKRYVGKIQNHFDRLNEVFGKNVSSSSTSSI